MNTLLERGAFAVAIAMFCFSSAPAFSAENPMESVGIGHNLYLECLSLSKDQSISPLRRVVEECGYDPGMPTDRFVEKYQAMIEMDPTLPMARRMAAYRDNYTAYQFSFFERVDDIVAVARDQTEADIMIAKLEDEAVARLDVKNESDRSVLSMLTTMRYSIRYWSASENSGSVVAARWPKWIRVLTVAVCDGAGVAIGGLAGGAGASTMAHTILNELDPPTNP